MGYTRRRRDLSGGLEKRAPGAESVFAWKVS
jgi:hypothetical protein